MKNLQIIEDWEREALKEFVYLCEESQELQKEIQEELNRKPAQIFVVDQDNVLNKTHEIEHHPLPF